jgi:hypothetical protein
MGALTSLKEILKGSDVTGNAIKGGRGKPQRIPRGRGKKTPEANQPYQMERAPVQSEPWKQPPWSENHGSVVPAGTRQSGRGGVSTRKATDLNPNKYPVKRGTSEVQAPPLKAAGRGEKFMGNAEVVRDSLPYAGSGGGGKKVGRYILGGAVAGGVVYGLADTEDKGTKGGTTVPQTTATAQGGSSPTVPPKYLNPASGNASPSPASSSKPKSKATATPKGSSAPKGSSGSRSMRGTELANYLGLGANSAVRANLAANNGEKPRTSLKLKAPTPSMPRGSSTKGSKSK